MRRSLPCPLCGIKIARDDYLHTRNSHIRGHLRETHKRTQQEAEVLIKKFVVPLEPDDER
jgi:hypothetical protein